MPHDILVVDDEADIRDLVSGILTDEGYEARSADGGESALAAITARRPSLIILDIWLQGSRLDGLGILEVVRHDHPELPVLMISGHGTIETAVTAIKHGAYDFIEKPFKADRLLLLVERAIEAATLRRENQELRLRAGEVTELTGNSAAINQVRQTIDKVAPTGSRVLISGPPGAGKEVVARLLHRRSRRSGGPFVVVNAANMAPERLEVELFGTVNAEGGRKTGMFEQAHGGTLFIDEVSDMPLLTQGKILRVLVEQTFERVGGDTRVTVDVRVVSATSRDLRAGIEEGLFREDLYHRLNVVPIKVPPLANRPEDIPLLAAHFMSRLAESTGMTPKEIERDVMAAMQSHSWPGNVRQLRNIVERLLILGSGIAGTRQIDLLPAELTSPPGSDVRPASDGSMMGLSLRDARDNFERAYLIAQIQRFDGNISRTASFIGMERSALHRKLKTLNVTAEDRRAAASA